MNPAVIAARKIDGWMPDHELAWLSERAALRERIVEFGCYKGRSTKALAMSTPGIVYAVDIWRDEEILREFRANLSAEILGGKVIVCRVETRAYFYADKTPADMVFIDADHSEDGVKADIEAARRILSPSGLLCGHDFMPSWPGVKLAVLKNVPGFSVAPGTTIWQKDGRVA